MKILESFVDSSSIFYICEVRGLMSFYEGLLCYLNPFNSAFAYYGEAANHYRLGRQVVLYPLYSGGSKEVRN
jgi:hypothetical protein